MRKFLALLTLAVSALFVSVSAQAGALTNYAENKIADAVMRAQTLGAPTTWHIGLDTVACTEAGGGTEVTGGNYARVAVAASLTAWSGTQAAASTVASTGTNGTTSNNAAINWTTPTWTATVVSVRFWDASTGGNAWICTTLAASKVVNIGDALGFPAASLSVQFDD